MTYSSVLGSAYIQYLTASRWNLKDQGGRPTVRDQTPVRQRVRITYGKAGPLKYTSNLDIAKVWERVLRRAHLPICYTQGFNTRPRIQLATALPLGLTSDCELLDVHLRERIDFDGVPQRLREVSPAGLHIHHLHEIPISAPAAETLIRSARYRITFPDGIDHDVLQQRVKDILQAEQIVRVTTRRNNKKSATDLRPLILDLHTERDEDGSIALVAHLSAGSRGNLRPDVLLEHMQLNDYFVNMHRSSLILTEHQT